MIKTRTFAAAILAIALTGCVVLHLHNGPQWIGKPVSALVADRGMPDRQLTSPAGAAVYVYRDTDEGDLICAAQYYVRGGRIVGYAERGEAVNCGGNAGAAR